MATTASSSGDDPGQRAAGPAQSTGAGTSPADRFRAFLVGLATDPAKLGSFIRDPDATMEAAGISSADQSILKSGNPSVIHSRLGRPVSMPQPPVTVLIVDMISASGDSSDAAAEPFVRTATIPPQAASPVMPQGPSSPSQAIPPIFRQALSTPAPLVPMVWSGALSSPPLVPVWPTYAIHGAAPPALVHPQIAYSHVYGPAYPPLYPQFYQHPYQQLYPQFSTGQG